MSLLVNISVGASNVEIARARIAGMSIEEFHGAMIESYVDTIRSLLVPPAVNASTQEIDEYSARMGALDISQELIETFKSVFTIDTSYALSLLQQLESTIADARNSVIKKDLTSLANRRAMLKNLSDSWAISCAVGVSVSADSFVSPGATLPEKMVKIAIATGLSATIGYSIFYAIEANLNTKRDRYVLYANALSKALGVVHEIIESL